MRRKRKKSLDIGLIFWIISMALILSITIYKHYQAVSRNRELWKEYRRIEREIEAQEKEIDFRRRGGER